jgi:prepilin-type N-terminal cleavage/methylation domain-containing protein
MQRVLGACVLFFIGAVLAAASACSPALAEPAATGPLAGVPAASVAPPYILANLQSFQGRIDYTAHRIDGAAVSVSGVAIIGGAAWSVDERAPGYVFHAGSDGATVLIGSTQARAADPLNADPLANAWVVALAELASARLAPRLGSRTGWSTPAGVIFYTDAAQTSIMGVDDRATPTSPSFVFEGWQQISGMALPERILRLRNGVGDATFAVDHYAVTRAIAPGDAAFLAARALRSSSGVLGRMQLLAPPSLRDATGFPWRLVLTAFGLLLLGLCLVAWTLRDVMTFRYCAWLAQDPRGWRGIGSSIFVSAEGMMYFDECVYKVGPDFYARNVLVQSSPLFLRFSAPKVTKAVIVPRKFRPLPAAKRLAPMRARLAGFSLIEMLVASAVLATVIVVGVFPALIAVARSDSLAAQQRAALMAATNALTDQESASAYGTAVVDGTTTSLVDGQTVTIDVHPSALSSAAHDIVVSVADGTGRVLARVATTVGPSVPVPGSQTTPVGDREGRR